MDLLKKGIVLAVVIVVGAPFAVKLWPKPASFERALAAFEGAGMMVDVQSTENRALEATEGWLLNVDGIRVELLRYESEGKIAKQLEYQKKDAGTAIVETMNIAQSLGAAQHVQTPSEAARNGKYMIVATGHDKDKLHAIVALFRGL